MVFPDRTATTGEPIAITMAKIHDYPAIPESQNGLDVPVFLGGKTRATSGGPDIQGGIGPILWTTAYDSSIPEFTGLLAMGASHADHGLLEAGTGASDENSGFFEKQGYVGGLSVGFNVEYTAADPTYIDPLGGVLGVGVFEAYLDFTFQRQDLGDFIGGTASVVSADAVETQRVTFSDFLSNVYTSFIGAALDGSALAVAAVSYWHGTSQPQDKVIGLKIGASGSIEKIDLFRIGVDSGTTIFAQCQDGSQHTFLHFLDQGGGVQNKGAVTICEEGGSYSNYTAKFDDPDLPGSLGELLTDYETDTSSDPDYRWLATYGTAVGFLISYLKFNGSTWDPKFVQVDKAWSTVQHVEITAGDVTAETILAQGVRDPDALPEERTDYAGNLISLIADGAYYFLIGGTPDVPLIVESGVPAGESGDPTLRSWGFSLDGHDFYCLRLGDSETLVYDLTTGQWADWRTFGRTNWRAITGQNWVGAASTTMARGWTDIVAGDDTEGLLWILDPSVGRDDTVDGGTAQFTRIVTGGVTLTGRQTVPCGAVTLDLNLGAPAMTGAAITLRTSDNQGENWTDHGAITIAAGDTSATVEWRALGIIRAPGRVFEFSDNGAAVRLNLADLR